MKVLLVDDESYMTEYLKKLVDWKSYGFEEVLTASGGSIARDLIEQKKPELLVTDIRMPRVSGLDLVKYIDEKNYPTKTIILSGYSEFEYAQQALRYGVTEYLVKPILKKDFQISLEHVMEKFFEKVVDIPIFLCILQHISNGALENKIQGAFFVYLRVFLRTHLHFLIFHSGV